MPEIVHARSISRAHALRDVIVQVIGRIGNLALGVVVISAILRTIGVDGNGEWSTLQAVLTMTGYMADLGLQATTVRMAAAAPEQEAGWLGALVVWRTALGVPAALLCFGVSAAVARTGAMVIAGALLAASLIISAGQSLGVAFQLRVRNDRGIGFMTLNSILWTAAVGAVALVHGGVVAFALAFLITTTLTTAAQTTYVLRRTAVALSGVRRHGRELMRVGVAVGIGSALTIAYAKVDQVLVLHFRGARGAGLYGAAYLLLDRVQFLPAVLMTTAFPILSSAWPADPQRARRITQRALESMALISLPALAFTLAAAGPLLTLLFGVQFAPAAGALRVLMGAFVLTCFGYVVGYLAVIVDRQRVFVLIALAGLAFNVAANVILLPHHGYIAAAWVTLVTEVVVLVPAALTTLRALGHQPRLGRLPRAALAAAAMGLAVWACQRAGVGVVLLALLALTVYPLAVLASGALTPEDRALLWSRLLRR